MTKIWFSDINAFFHVNNLFEVFPSNQMTKIEKLNTLFRLSIYIGIIIFLTKNTNKGLYLPIVVGCVTYVFSVYADTEEEYEDLGFVDETENYLENHIRNKMNKKNYTLPTKDNPFMNVLMNEYEENPNRKRAIHQNRVNDEIDEYFNDNLYRSIDDIYSKNASDRQYITMPNTQIPNDQESFARSLYYVHGKTRKEMP